MSANIEIVKQIAKAFQSKDKEGFRSLLHDRYTFQGPVMQMSSPDEAAEYLSKCPMVATYQNALYTSADDKVVQVFDWVVSEPFQETFRMCSVVTIKDGKVFREELIYDSAKFPKEFLEQMSQGNCS
ncbi:MAG: nuclear transport factor 2 family protein [Candidatus Omnitrophota bacterium]|nr:nuclear transport factor 2 family protein [Candidatus Omnitrophota bacterium]